MRVRVAKALRQSVAIQTACLQLVTHHVAALMNPLNALDEQPVAAIRMNAQRTDLTAAIGRREEGLRGWCRYLGRGLRFHIASRGRWCEKRPPQWQDASRRQHRGENPPSISFSHCVRMLQKPAGLAGQCPIPYIDGQGDESANSAKADEPPIKSPSPMPARYLCDAVPLAHGNAASRPNAPPATPPRAPDPPRIGRARRRSGPRRWPRAFPS